MTGLTDSGFLQLIQGGIHNLEATSIGSIRTTQDRWKLALYTAAATVSKATTAYTTNGEVTGGGYTAGGADVALDVSVFPEGGVQKVKVDFPNIQYTSSPTFTYRKALLYNASSGKGNATLAYFEDTADRTAAGTVFNIGPRSADNMKPIVFG